MRFGFLLLLISFLLQLHQNVSLFPGNIVNHYYLNKQRFLLEILHHLHEPLLHEQWLGLGQQIVTDKSQYVHYNDHMVQFYQLLSTGRLLPRDVYYNPQQPEHYQQTLGLFHFFYNTREWSTLRQNICWARIFVNPGLFLYALMQTLMKRDDYRALIVPKIYELLPAPYYDEQLVHTAISFNYANQVWDNETESKLQKSKQSLPLNLAGELRNTSKWTEAMSEVQILSLKPNEEAKGLALLTEDPGWRAYWYSINMATTLLEEPQETERLRDWWYWQLSQLVARYKLERYGQGKDYRRMLESEKLKTFTTRTWLYQRYGDEREDIEKQLKKWEFKVEESLSTGSYQLSNGSRIELSHSQNWQIGLTELFPYDLNQLQLHFKLPKEPQQLLDLHTMLGDHKFYIFADRSILRLYRAYRAAFQPDYTQQIKPTEMRLLQVQVTPLITYEESVDFDISNLLHARHFYVDNQFVWPQTLQVRRQRLQHQPFTINFQLESNKTQSIILRTFLTTAGGDLHEEPFYQLDAFLTVLHAGNNTITRESVDFAGTVGDHLSFTELYHYVRLAERDEFDFPLNITIPSCGFPRRLLLPQGGVRQPLAMRLFVIATPYNFKARQEQELICDFSNGVSSWDELPFGYPFERQLEEESELLGENTMFQTVEILHEDRSSLTKQ